MSSSWRRQAYNLLVIAAALAAAAVLAMPRPAAAAGCPTTPVSELGGSHWCYKHSGKGSVHLWTPPGYQESTAITVIFVHGLDTGNNGPDTCHGKRPYVDCIWDASDHGIVKQFAASGVNALFVAVEGQTEISGDSARWSTLDSLTSSIRTNGKITPPASVTAAGHSAGMYTVRSLMKSTSVKHVIDLDWVKGRESPPLSDVLTSWIKDTSQSRKLTLIGGSGQKTYMDKMRDAIPCVTAKDPASLSGGELTAACLYQRISFSGGGSAHMRTVTDKVYLPEAIKRSGAPTSGTATTGPSGTVNSSAGGTISAGPVADATIDAPLLEIPVPGLELSGAIRSNGVVTIPWLAQYIGGVYTFLLGIVGVVAAVMMMIGGFEYMTSGGDKGRVGKGKERIMNALSGLVLALGSYVILYAINPNLVAFDGLKIQVASTERSGETPEQAHDEGDVYPASAEPPAGSPVAGGLPRRVCGTVETCRPYCQAANCVATKKCAPNATTGVEECKATVTCDLSKFPQSAPGIIDAASAVNAQKAFTGQVGIRAASSGDLVSPAVRDGLIRAGKIADREGYEIVMTDGFRTLPKQFDLVCTRIIKADFWRPTKPDVADTLIAGIGGAVAWPGGSLHGAGFAADIQLHRKGGGTVVCSGCCGTQFQAQYKEPSIMFDKIMTEAGARRYSNEIWHYEFGAPASVTPRCTYPNCSWPPSCTGKQASG